MMKMKMKSLKRLLIAILLPFCISATAQETAVDSIIRPVLSVYSAEIGSAHIVQTYLSPLRNSGLSVALNYERMQAMRFDPDRWVMRLTFGVDGARTYNNPARNKVMWNMGLSASWSMSRRWNFADWSLFAGGFTAIDGGANYVPANGNNPVAANAAWTVGATAAAAWHTKLFNTKVTFRYLAEMPITGVFFAPEYGQLYYEIYLGNTNGLVRAAWPGNFFRLNNLLSADFRFGGTTLRLGYRLNINSVKASDIVSREIQHLAVIGVASEWISLNFKKRPSANARIISALY